MFSVPHATIHRIIAEVSDELHQRAKEEISLPRPAKYEALKSEFSSLSNAVGIILAVDGTQRKICRPDIAQPFDFYDRKGCFIITFVCVADYRQRFRDITWLWIITRCQVFSRISTQTFDKGNFRQYMLCCRRFCIR
ncbi:hypothetical protein ENBRE01_2909 [Enteropsectra breve]|nr:hypothetical protein ENBRE01_2909 [Enteropsectra breve]